MTDGLKSTHQELRRVLLECGPFESNSSIRTIFLVRPLSIWRGLIPEADSQLERVDRLIEFLIRKYTDQQENGLLLFLQELINLLDSRDGCQSRLIYLRDQLKIELDNENRYYSVQKPFDLKIPEIVNELAKHFHNREDAHSLLQAVHFPSGIRPEFRRYPSAIAYWEHVCARIHFAPGGIKALIIAASRECPQSDLLNQLTARL